MVIAGLKGCSILNEKFVFAFDVVIGDRASSNGDGDISKKNRFIPVENDHYKADQSTKLLNFKASF